MKLKPLTTEKAIMAIESQNLLTFLTEKGKTKDEIKKNVQEIFDVEVKKVRTLLRNNKKYAYVKLKKKFPAMDVATKLGLI